MNLRSEFCILYASENVTWLIFVTSCFLIWSQYKSTTARIRVCHDSDKNMNLAKTTMVRCTSLPNIAYSAWKHITLLDTKFTSLIGNETDIINILHFNNRCGFPISIGDSTGDATEPWPFVQLAVDMREVIGGRGFRGVQCRSCSCWIYISFSVWIFFLNAFRWSQRYCKMPITETAKCEGNAIIDNQDLNNKRIHWSFIIHVLTFCYLCTQNSLVHKIITFFIDYKVSA